MVLMPETFQSFSYVPFIHKVLKLRAEYPTRQLWWRLNVKKAHVSNASEGISTVNTKSYVHHVRTRPCGQCAHLIHYVIEQLKYSHWWSAVRSVCWGLQNIKAFDICCCAHIITQGCCNLKKKNMSRCDLRLTASWSPWGAWLWGELAGGCLPFYWEAKNLFQLLSIRWWDGETSNGHFNQGQPHTPDV